MVGLAVLDLHSNELSGGRYRRRLGSLSYLARLDLSGNELSGGDTAGAGQPLQPDRAGPPQQRIERGRYRRSWAASPT